MYRDRTIAVVVPAYNEDKLVGRVIETMPSFVDRIVVVDDKSTDRTADAVRGYQTDERVVLIQHEENQGVGGAIVTGYRWVLDREVDVAVVMAGDAQMDPQDLPSVLDPVVDKRADYVKGNRLVAGDAWAMIPKYRYLGNSLLSLLTKIASGYWHIADSQTGYTAISLRALKLLDLDRIYRRYGYPNDMLVRLNVLNCVVRDVPVKPVYNIGEQSGIRLYKVMPRMSWLLLKLFLWRMKEKYVVRDFHPLLFFYAMGMTLFPLGVVFGVYLVILRLAYGPVAGTSALFAAFLTTMGLQSLFFAMWFDMDYNRDLR